MGRNKGTWEKQPEGEEETRETLMGPKKEYYFKREELVTGVGILVGCVSGALSNSEDEQKQGAER